MDGALCAPPLITKKNTSVITTNNPEMMNSIICQWILKLFTSRLEAIKPIAIPSAEPLLMTAVENPRRSSGMLSEDKE
ncbi:hypothetical protein D3C79_938740 [compost metagenome]